MYRFGGIILFISIIIYLFGIYSTKSTNETINTEEENFDIEL